MKSVVAYSVPMASYNGTSAFNASHLDLRKLCSHIELSAGAYVPTDFFEGAAMLLTFILLGKWLEARASTATCAKLSALAALAPDRAALVHVQNSKSRSNLILNFDDAAEEDIDARLVHVGDVLRVRPGGRVPADGTLLRGSTTVDESMVTGALLRQLPEKQLLRLAGH